MEPAKDTHGTATRHEYRRTSGYQMDDRRLILRGGAHDGESWTGVIAVGKRVFCGEGAWSTDGVYLVTDQVEIAEDGEQVNIAVPAFA